MGSIHVPAIGWQDDITILAKDKKEEDAIVKTVIESAKQQRINFSEDKCKFIVIGNKKDDFDNVKFGEIKLEKIESGKVYTWFLFQPKRKQ